MVRPLNEATPLVTVADEPFVTEGPPAIETVIVPDTLVSTLPPTSSIASVGCVPRASPLPADDDGVLVRTSFDPAVEPTVTLSVATLTPVLSLKVKV
jgi:hypothetical protein